MCVFIISVVRYGKRTPVVGTVFLSLPYSQKYAVKFSHFLMYANVRAMTKHRSDQCLTSLPRCLLAAVQLHMQPFFCCQMLFRV